MNNSRHNWSMWDDIQVLVDWLDESNGLDDHELTLRIAKIGEEYGEAIAARVGMVGQNPRKGVTHTRADLADELCYVIVTAAVALTSLLATRSRHAGSWPPSSARSAHVPLRPRRRRHDPPPVQGRGARNVITKAILQVTVHCTRCGAPFTDEIETKATLSKDPPESRKTPPGTSAGEGPWVRVDWTFLGGPCLCDGCWETDDRALNSTTEASR